MVLWRISVFFFLFSRVYGFSLTHCDFGDLEVILECGHEKYYGNYEIELYDRDVLTDELMYRLYGKVNPGDFLIMKAKLTFENCDDVDMFVRIHSFCPKELSFGNYGLTTFFEIFRRWMKPAAPYEVCVSITKDRSQWPVTVQLDKESYCGLSEI